MGYWHTQHYLNTRETHVYSAIGMCLASYLVGTVNVYAKIVTKSRNLRWKACSTQGKMMHAFEIYLDGLERCISRNRLEVWIKHQRCISSELLLTYLGICLGRSFTDFVLRHRLHRQVDKNCVLPGYYAANSNNSLPTFRGNLSFPSSRVKYPNNHAFHREVLYKFSKSCYFDITVMQSVVPSSIFLGLSLFFVTNYRKQHRQSTVT
jgi:hypothetical protein